jgi:phosphoglucomutase/phosphomannomutase
MTLAQDVVQKYLSQLQQALSEGKISQSAASNIERWLVEPRYAEYAPQVAQLIDEGQWKLLDDVFWQVIPFGTGGRRGRMFPVGCNAINDRTIGESAQGVADYVKSVFAGQQLACAIAYDTRHRSRQFAELCAGVMAASGYKVYFLDGFRSTPELSFAVRYKGCQCGIMVTASHNPPSDNAVKVYWSSGGQVLPPHDERMIKAVMAVQDIKRMPFEEGVRSGQIVCCQEEVDRAFVEAILRQSQPGPRNLRILYSPLHGVGATAVVPALQAAGFEDVHIYGPHAEPNGDFPNVPDHIANPENKAVFEPLIAEAVKIGADIALATDPDCDRLGCAVPIRPDRESPWTTLTGNQIGALLTDYVIRKAQERGRLSARHYVVETLVTTRLIGRIARKFGVRVIDDLMVGFKWIGATIDYEGPEYFLLGAEESYGFLIGDHARDKDGAVAAMVLCELAAELKASEKTLAMRLDELFTTYGLHEETAFSIALPGQEGMQRMVELMNRFRTDPPKSLGGKTVARVRDLNQPLGQYEDEMELAMAAARRGNVVVLELDQHGHQYVAVRPSGTEPKCKFYIFGYIPPEDLTDLAKDKITLRQQLDAIAGDLRTYATR